MHNNKAGLNPKYFLTTKEIVSSCFTLLPLKIRGVTLEVKAGSNSNTSYPCRSITTRMQCSIEIKYGFFPLSFLNISLIILN